jgi:hypothetical protein
MIFPMILLDTWQLQREVRNRRCSFVEVSEILVRAQEDAALASGQRGWGKLIQILMEKSWETGNLWKYRKMI